VRTVRAVAKLKRTKFGPETFEALAADLKSGRVPLGGPRIARTVQALAEQGIDAQAGLHERLIRELKAKGIRWRP
jgi:hypothetical protein